MGVKEDDNEEPSGERTGEALHREFEISMLFEIKKGALSFKRKENGDYLIPKMQYAFVGYQVRSRNDWAHLKRFAPTRYLTNGHETQFRALLDPSTRELVKNLEQKEIHDLIRAALVVAGGSPAS